MHPPHDSQPQRSDAAVFVAARRRLDDSPIVPGTVRVHIDRDLVTLTGTVERLAQRAEAERLVRPVIGTRRLVDAIIVLPTRVDETARDGPG